MLRRSLYRTDLIWLGVIVAAVAAPWLLPDFRSDAPTDSFRTGLRGKKAFYLIADRLDYYVERNFSPLATFLRRYEGYESGTVLMMLGPARQPTDREWEALSRFVDAGGAILFAAASDKPVFDATPFDVLGQERDEPIDLDGTRKAALQIDLGELTGTFSWQSRGELLAPKARQIVVAEESVQAIVQRRGLGTAIFVATDRPFDNRTLTWPDNALTAVRLLETAGWNNDGYSVIFDESLNVSGTPKVVALLLDWPLRPAALHFVALLAVFGWWRSRRFGPVLPPSVPTRSDIVAHADAVGMLHYKTRDGRSALRYYLRQLTSELKLRKLVGLREARVLDAIARRSGRSVDDVKHALRQAAGAIKSEQLDRTTAAKHIRRLAQIRRAARRG